MRQVFDVLTPRPRKARLTPGRPECHVARALAVLDGMRAASFTGATTSSAATSARTLVGHISLVAMVAGIVSGPSPGRRNARPGPAGRRTFKNQID
jgi:hypothetical protein